MVVFHLPLNIFKLLNYVPLLSLNYIPITSVKIQTVLDNLVDKYTVQNSEQSFAYKPTNLYQLLILVFIYFVWCFICYLQMFAIG